MIFQPLILYSRFIMGNTLEKDSHLERIDFYKIEANAQIERKEHETLH